jgi:hypothetical protein
MFKIGTEVFDNERGYGEGVVTASKRDEIYVEFTNSTQTYTADGRRIQSLPITLFKKEEKMKNYYYVGQKVSHQAFGDGVVTSISELIEVTTPVIVKFGENYKSFTIDGRYKKEEFPSLSQKPHVPLELEEVVTFEKGELVWVRNGDIWDARYYSHFNGKNHYYFSNQRKEGNDYTVTEVRKFSDNPLV